MLVHRNGHMQPIYVLSPLFSAKFRNEKIRPKDCSQGRRVRALFTDSVVFHLISWSQPISFITIMTTLRVRRTILKVQPRGLFGSEVDGKAVLKEIRYLEQDVHVARKRPIT